MGPKNLNKKYLTILFAIFLMFFSMIAKGYAQNTGYADQDFLDNATQFSQDSGINTRKSELTEILEVPEEIEVDKKSIQSKTNRSKREGRRLGASQRKKTRRRSSGGMSFSDMANTSRRPKYKIIEPKYSYKNVSKSAKKEVTSKKQKKVKRFSFKNMATEAQQRKKKSKSD